MAKLSIRKNGCFQCRPTKHIARPVKLPQWLVTATIGEHNHVELTVPAADILVAGDYAGEVLSGAANSVNSRPANYQIQSITQLV